MKQPITEEEQWETPYGKIPEEKTSLPLILLQYSVFIFLLGIIAYGISYATQQDVGTLRTNSFIMQ